MEEWRAEGAAIDSAEVALHEGRVEHEPAMTDRMLGRIEQSFEGFETSGIQWRAKTLTDRGPGSQESIVGADFMGVLHVDLPDYQTTKGFLAQAKLLRRSGVDDLRVLVDQCQRMLRLTPDSFVFLYSDRAVMVTSAVAVVAANGRTEYCPQKSATQFFKAHLECLIGDAAIQSATPDGLIRLRQERVRRALVIGAAPQHRPW